MSQHTPIVPTAQLLLVILSLLLAGAGAYYYGNQRQTAWHEAVAQQARLSVEQLAQEIDLHLASYMKAVKALSRTEEIRQAILHSDARDQANRTLQDYCETFKAVVCYLSDRENQLLAISNARNSYQLSRQSYPLRTPESIPPRPAIQPHLDANRHKRRIEFSHPVYRADDRAMLGTVVIEIDVDAIEDSLKIYPGLVLVSNPDGEVFLSNQLAWRFRTLQTAAEQDSHRPTAAGAKKADLVIRGTLAQDRQGSEYLTYRQPLQLLPGGEVAYLLDKWQLSGNLPVLLLDPVGIGVLLTAVVIMTVAFILFRIAQRDIARHKHTEATLRENQERFELAMYGAKVGLWDWKLDTEQVYFSPRWKDMLGYRENEIGNHLAEWHTRIHPDDFQKVMETIKAHLDGKTDYYENEYRLRHKEGHYLEILDHGIAVRDASNSVARLVGTNLDITARKQTEEQLANTQALFLAAIEQTPAGIIIAEAPDVSILIANPAALAIRGHSSKPLTGVPVQQHMDTWQTYHPDGTPYQPEELPLSQAVLYGKTAKNVDVMIRRQNGEERWVLANAAPVRNAAGAIIAGVVVFSDITERKQAEQKLRDKEARLEYLSHHDVLTGLPNRLLFYDRLHHAMRKARRTGQQVGLLLLDLDRFKLINDSLGHEAGDRLLKETAQRLQTGLRKGDTVARLGGDEFVVVLGQVKDIEDVATVARKILQDISQPVALDSHDIFVTTSVGIGLFPNDSQLADGLMQCADAAMYRSKERGRNNYQFYTVDMNAGAFELLLLESDLRKAIEQDQLVVYYQPQFELNSGSLVGAEALLRWQHPKQGLISPDDFIPLAEETGLIISMGQWLTHSACAQLKAWQDAGYPPIRVGVNLSARQFRQRDLVQTVAYILEETELKACYLELELTESIIVQKAVATIATLAALSRMGVTLTIDDFGIGYSSLSYLKRFPINKVKIDQSFLYDIDHDANDAAIVASIIALARNMKLRVIAEGVESEEQASFLRAQGCDEAQGYLYGYPLPAEKFVRYFESTQQITNGGGLSQQLGSVS